MMDDNEYLPTYLWYLQETVGETLEELWISYNMIDKLKGVGSLKNLKVFYISNNTIKEWVEFNRLQVLILEAQYV